jgi:hypothetical protein
MKYLKEYVLSDKVSQDNTSNPIFSFPLKDDPYLISINEAILNFDHFTSCADLTFFFSPQR